MAKAGVDPAMVEDVFMGCGMPEGETGMNVARNATLWAGLPVPCSIFLSPRLRTTWGTNVKRFCSSGSTFLSLSSVLVLLFLVVIFCVLLRVR